MSKNNEMVEPLKKYSNFTKKLNFFFDKKMERSFLVNNPYVV